MRTSYDSIIALMWIFLVGLFLWYLATKDPNVVQCKTENKVDVCMEDTFTVRDFILELHIQEVQYPDIVLRQAALESGWFTSVAWRTKNNPFGFVGKDGYIMFNDWKSAIIYMKDWQDKYYKGGDYYLFLERRGYAEDSCYVETLKNMDLNNLKEIK